MKEKNSKKIKEIINKEIKIPPFLYLCFFTSLVISLIYLFFYFYPDSKLKNSLGVGDFFQGVILFWTLLIIWLYTYETKKLREEAQRTNELLLIPFVELRKKEENIRFYLSSPGGHIVATNIILKLFKDYNLKLLKGKDLIEGVRTIELDNGMNIINSGDEERFIEIIRDGQSHKAGKLPIPEINKGDNFFIQVNYRSITEREIIIIYEIKVKNNSFGIEYKGSNFFRVSS